MVRVNATIRERMDSKVPLIPQLAGHLIASGGKRMRPMMTIAGAMMTGAPPDQRAPAILLSTAVEFIHSATLLHDDVIDESALRRGQDTANALWGNDAAVLVGDFLFARAWVHLLSSISPHLTPSILGTVGAASMVASNLAAQRIAGAAQARECQRARHKLLTWFGLA